MPGGLACASSPCPADASSFSKNLEAFMTGSIVTVTSQDLATTACVGAVVLVVLLALHKELLYGAFDPERQRAAGYPVAALDLLMLLLVEAVIVVTAPAIGVMLAMALIVGPAATACLWTDRIRTTTLISRGVGTGSCALGLELSTRWNLAAGGTITLVIAAVFLLSLPSLRTAAYVATVAPAL
ncbi:metal ABC transporter permease [Streptomyces sp. NPDC060028]|uniref:metal ABC transporter permease n=1 Tax=Streptomyces sp. NPDC060028 TaxID=3347041 RepID=UPI0036880B0A